MNTVKNMKDDKNIPMKLEGVMSKKGADKAAIIIAWGKTIGFIFNSLAAFIYVLLLAWLLTTTSMATLIYMKLAIIIPETLLFFSVLKK